jgi:AhpC/TSA family
MMRKNVWAALAARLLLGALLAPPFAGPLRAEGTQPAAPKLKVGDVAPDFKLQYFDGSDLKDVSLNQYHGKKNVVLAFYIFAFTGG